VIGDEERSGWVDILNPAVYPPRESRRQSEPAPGCPDFGEDSVVDRGAKGARNFEQSVRPGLHVPQLGSHRVVWWDPQALDLGRDEEVGLRQERMLVPDEGGADEKSIADHAAWQESRTATLEAGRAPSLDVRSVTELSHGDRPDGSEEDGEEAREQEGREDGGGGIQVALAEVEGDRMARPGGRRFGTLVHAILAAVPLSADAGLIEEVARVQGRLVGASAEEVAGACGAVAAALRHPILVRAAAAEQAGVEPKGQGGLRRETPVLFRRSDGILAEGIVDLAFREDAAWTVVDFKTDRLDAREMEALRPEYAAQVRLYVEAIEAATEEPAQGVLLLV